MFETAMMEVARAAGRAAMSSFRALREGEVRPKGSTPEDLVTSVDLEIERMVREVLSREFPDHGILGEENGRSGGDELRFIVDPIDGTVNYAAGLPQFAFMLSRMEGGIVTHGATFLPAFDEMYWAEKGKGAFLNGFPIRVNSQVSRDALLATGFACLREKNGADNLPLVAAIINKVRGIRRFGSAGLDLAYVARGLFAGFWEMGLAPWDTAAGKLLVEEAGGVVTGFADADDPIFGGKILAASPVVHAEVRRWLDEAYHANNQQ